MMNSLNTLWMNGGPFGAYQVGGLMSLFFLLAIVDTAFKGWAMWRAARMKKQGWFVGLLVVSSAGILPVIFLLFTNEEYEKFGKGENKGMR